jgi:hypothetical protein
VREAFRGDTILLRDGTEFVVADMDPESGWPIVETKIGLVAIDPVYIQEGWDHDRSD